jgi:hypothetical protein
MAKNETRSEGAEFAQGCVDSTYIQLTPDRGGVVENPPIERLAWPQYAQAEQHIESPFLEAHMRRAQLPTEYKTASARFPHVGA